jgi:hypothetical protein
LALVKNEPEKPEEEVPLKDGARLMPEFSPMDELNKRKADGTFETQFQPIPEGVNEALQIVSQEAIDGCLRILGKYHDRTILNQADLMDIENEMLDLRGEFNLGNK